MPFSLRLTADLTLSLAARAMRARNGHPLILHVSPDGGFFSSARTFSQGSQQVWDDAPKSAVEFLQFRSPIIWIGGSEPLDHPDVARLTNELAAAGRHVFLETSGMRLKRRLHEFQPSNRFYITTRFDGLERSHDKRNAREGAFRLGLEAIRMARLAGFFTCAHIVLHPEMQDRETDQLHAQIHALDADGCLITRASLAPELEHKAAQVRRCLLRRPWALLSRLLDSAPLPATSRVSPETQRPPLPASESSGFGEGAEA